MADRSTYRKVSDGWRPVMRRHDSSGLTVAERNAVILYSKRAYLAAAKALGWNGTPSQSPRDFIDSEIERIREKVARLHRERRLLLPPAPEPKEEKMTEVNAVPPPEPEAEPPRRLGAHAQLQAARIDARLEEIARLIDSYREERDGLIRARMALTGERPDQLDEREAQPEPPPGIQKLDEREQEVPPPGPPPTEPPEPGGEAKPKLEDVRDWVVRNRDQGEFKSADVRAAFPALDRNQAKSLLNELIRLGIIVKRGERGGTRYRYNTGPRPGEDAPLRPGNGGPPIPGEGAEAPPDRGLPVPGIGRRERAGTVGRTPR